MYSAKEFGIRVERTNGDEEYCLCPFHGDSNPSASFNRSKGLLYCYVCNRGWNVRQLQEALDVELVHLNQSEPDDFNLLGEEQVYDMGDKWFVDYFAERGISPGVIAEYGVRWKGSEPKAAVLPIRNLRGDLKGVMHRYLEGPTRYKVFGKTTPVWPMPLLNLPRKGYILVTEGAWSAMKISTFLRGSMEIFMPLALLGAKANQQIVDTLISFNVVFIYDGDKAGENACRKMRKLFPTAYSWTVSKSPDDMDDYEIQMLLSKITGKVICGGERREHA